MDYKAYLSDEGMKKAKIGCYKSNIVKSIENIGQKKLVIIGGGEEYNLLLSALSQLRSKGVKVPETAFRAAVLESDVSEQEDIRPIRELSGKSDRFFALVLAPFTPLEIRLAAMSEVPYTSASVGELLKSEYGFSDRDYCELNEPTGISMTLVARKLARALDSDGRKSAAMENATAPLLSAHKDKMKGQRCFILGGGNAKLDELNGLMNEHSFAANEFCDFFTRTPQRPSFFVVTKESEYRGNGKYIEGMECFIEGQIRVFEDKFKKKPVYFNGMGAGFLNGLPSFSDVCGSFETAKIFPLYVMLQLALYMDFGEIYIYGWADGEVSKEAQELINRLKTFADSSGSRLISMGGFDLPDKVAFEQVDLSASSIFGRI